MQNVKHQRSSQCMGGFSGDILSGPSRLAHPPILLSIGGVRTLWSMGACSKSDTHAEERPEERAASQRRRLMMM